jgi:hypothetical protein
MTDQEHNKYIAFTFLAHGAFQLLMMLFIGLMMLLMMSVGPAPGQPAPPMAFFGIFFVMMFVFQSVFTAPSFVAAYALFKRKPWARIASIVAGILAAVSVPVGTAACVYSMWFFLGERWKSVYPDLKVGAALGLDRGYGDPANVRSRDEANQREFSYQDREPPDWR